MNSEDKVLYASRETDLDLNVLYSNHHLAVKKISLRYCDYNNDLAEDAVQQSYLALMEAIGKGVVIEKPLTYLLTISKNYTLTQIRNLKREHLNDDIVGCSDQVRFGNDVEELYFEKLSQEKLEKALNVLKEKNETWHRIVMEVYINGESQVEVAEKLGLSKEAVYALVHRIKTWTIKNMMDYRE